MTPRRDPPSPPATPDQQDRTLLIADVAALTGVSPTRLRSWEQAGLLRPCRTPNAFRLYGIEDVARVRLLKRAVVNPGRRGSLRRLAAQLASGTLLPAPEDYAGLVPVSEGPAPLTDSKYWQAVVGAMGEFVIVCDTAGHVTSMNPALWAVLPSADPERTVAEEGPGDLMHPGRSLADDALPAPLEALPLRWAAQTGTQHRDVALLLRAPSRADLRTLWTVIPLRDADGVLHGAVGVGRAESMEQDGREDWLAMAAHDLRGPVTTVLGRLQLARRAMAGLRTGEEPAVRQKVMDHLDQHLALAELSTIDLIRMMNTLLDASAAAAGSLIQHLEPGGVALDLLARQAVDHAQQHTSRHLLALDVPETPLLVAGDRQRLRQVLDNLLANAIKYAPDGGPITMRLEAVASLPMVPPDPAVRIQVDSDAVLPWVVVRVADTGLGIPPDAVPHVFDRYWRASGPTQGIPGTGLGLYTCRAIVLAHGGHIWVEESVPATGDTMEAGGWHGTVIALVLPLAAPYVPVAGVDDMRAAEPLGTATG